MYLYISLVSPLCGFASLRYDETNSQVVAMSYINPYGSCQMSIFLTARNTEMKTFTTHFDHTILIESIKK